MLKLSSIYKELLTETVERNKLIKAIEDKRLMTIYYESPQDGDKADYPKGWRRVEPFCYGINKHDNAVLRAWELHGVSYSYPPGKDGSDGGKTDPLTNIPGWRMFRIDGIKQINETGSERFLSARPKYNPEDKDMKIIYKAAKFDGDDNQNQIEPETPLNPAQTSIPEPNATPIPTSTQQTSTEPAVTPSTSGKFDSSPFDHSGDKRSWFTKFGDKFKNIVNFGKKDTDKI